MVARWRRAEQGWTRRSRERPALDGEPERGSRAPASRSQASLARCTDGRGACDGEHAPCVDAGEGQSGCSGYRRDAHRGLRCVRARTLADDSRAPERWQLPPAAGAPGDDPEARWRRAAAGDTDRNGPVDPASHCASPDADLRSGFLRIELRLPAETLRPWSAQAGTSPHRFGLPHRRRFSPWRSSSTTSGTTS